VQSELIAACGNFGAGLLYLIPFTNEAPYYVPQDLSRITDVKIKEFHDLVGTREAFVRSLCEFGSSFQKMILESQEIELKGWFTNFFSPVRAHLFDDQIKAQQVDCKRH